MISDNNLNMAWTAQPKGSTIVLRRLAVAVAVAVGTIGIVATSLAAASLAGRVGAQADQGGSAEIEGDQGGSAVVVSDGAVDGTDPAVPGPYGPDEEAELPVVADPAQAPLLIDGQQSTRFVAAPNERLLNTGGSGETPVPPPPPGTAHPLDVGPEVSAVALSISVMATEQSGSVLVDGQAGSVEALTVGGPGATVTNLVFIPVVDGALSIRSSAGGHLVVDLVGSFEPSGPTTAGRFVAVDPTEIASLETAVEGRELDLAFTSGGGIAFEQASAVLVSIEADVGTEGGRIQIGPDADSYDQMLMWAAAAPDNPLRRGLVLLEPSSEQLGSLRYEGGSELTVDVVGYFTNDLAEVTTSGLFVPTGPRVLVDGSIGPDAPLIFALDDSPAAAVVSVGSNTAIQGQLGTIVLPVTGPEIVLRPTAEFDVIVTLLGVFL